MIKYENYEKARNVNIVDVLRICNMYPDKYGRYLCPFHSDTNASAYVKVNRLFCFACSNTEHDGWSTIDIVMQVKGVSKEDAVKTILSLCTGDTSCFDKEPIIKKEKNRIKLKREEKPEFEEVRESFLKKAKEIKDSKKDDLIKYLNSRKINERVLAILDKNGILYGTDSMGQPGFVFGYKHCVFRAMSKNVNYSLAITEGANSYIEIKSNPIPVFYIVEGIYDALTLLDRDYPPNVICLNSTSNAKDLIKTIQADLNHQKRIYILALDMDDAGQKTAKALINTFENNNIRYSKYLKLYNSNCNDVNELRQKDII